MTKTTGDSFIAHTLKGYGVTHVFFVPQMLMGTLIAMEDMGIRRVLAHSEKAAAYMADGYARASGQPGICLAQHIGASNLAAGLRDAYLGCSPVIAMTGGPAPEARYRHAYQELEDFTQFDQTTKFNVRVDDVTRLPDLLRQAFRVALTGSPGPVHLQLLGHHAEMAVAEADLEIHVEDRFRRAPPYRPPAEESMVEEAVKRLNAAERPIIIAGGGVAWSGAQSEVVALAERLSIPVVTSLDGRGTILDTHPLSVGTVGVYSRACANRAVSESDLVFFIGSRTGGQVTTRWLIPRPGTPVIHLDIDAQEIGRNYLTEVALLGDSRTVLRQMLAAISDSAGNGRAPWIERVKTLVREWQESAAAQRNADALPMRPERLCREISLALPEGAVVVCGTGHSGIWAGTMIDFTKPGQRLIRAAGSLGWGFPGALGVKCALPEAPVICFTGDGGLYYHLAELETAARYGINLVVVVNNNGALNQEIPHFDKAHGGDPDEHCRDMWGFNEVDFARVAESLGCMGIRVERPGELQQALRKALDARRPVVIDAVTNYRAFAQKVWTGA